MNCDGDENCHSWDWSLHTQAFRECPWSIGASAQIQVCLVLKKNHNNCKSWTPNRRWKRVVLLACFFRKNPGPTNSTIGMIRNSGTPHIENIPMPLRNLDIWTSFCPRLALRAKKAKLFKMRRYVFKSHVSILFPDWLHLEVVFERLILVWFLWWHAFLWNFKNINNKKTKLQKYQKAFAFNYGYAWGTYLNFICKPHHVFLTLRIMPDKRHFIGWIFDLQNFLPVTLLLSHFLLGHRILHRCRARSAQGLRLPLQCWIKGRGSNAPRVSNESKVFCLKMKWEAKGIIHGRFWGKRVCFFNDKHHGIYSWLFQELHHIFRSCSDSWGVKNHGLYTI